MHDSTCSQCQYFRQHYALDARKLYRVFCGHCTYASAKRKRPDTPSCDNFAPGEPDEAAFASREYLSKELLSYLRSLELLPEICDAEPPTKKRNGQ